MHDAEPHPCASLHATDATHLLARARFAQTRQTTRRRMVALTSMHKLLVVAFEKKPSTSKGWSIGGVKGCARPNLETKGQRGERQEPRD